MSDWFEKLVRRTLPPQPEPPPPPPTVEAEPDWRRELLNEAEFSWGAGPPAPPPAPVAKAPPLMPANWQPTAPPPLVRPVTRPRREVFTKHGYEPGQRPPNLQALTELFQAVYWPALDGLRPHVVADEELFTAIARWNERAPALNRPLLLVLFKRLSYWLGEALRFEPAALGYMDQGHDGMEGYYRRDSRKIFVATEALARPASNIVGLIAHEQMHHLQHLIVLLLAHKPHKLTEAERSLALYWQGEGQPDHRRDYLEYRLNGAEYHAEKTARYLVHRFAPIFEWPGIHAP